jgi:lysophospholipase L1-like esterase
MGAPERPTPPRRAKIALLVFFGAAVPLAAGEVLVRALFRYNTPDTVRENSLQYLPSLFSRHLLKPNQRVNLDEAWGVGPGPKGTGIVYSINRHGTRGADFAIPKPAGVRRIVILGGSSAFDIHAGEGADWPALAEARLREAGVGAVEVINAAVPGHASFDSLGRLYAQIWTWQPDFVLLYGAWNDVKYFTRLTVDSPLVALQQPFDNSNNPLASYRNPVDRLLAHSQIYVKLRTRYWLPRLDVGAEGALPEGGLRAELNPLALEQYLLNVSLFVDAARHRGIVPVLLTEATLVTANAAPEDRKRIAYDYARLEHDALARALAACSQGLREIARNQRVDLVDLDRALSGSPELFVDHVHTTPAGSQRIADLVAEYLARRLQPARR